MENTEKEMRWIKRQKTTSSVDLPRDHKFLALYKGCICLAEYDDQLGRFWLSLWPDADTGNMVLSVGRECKITHYCYLQKPEDY